MRKLVPPLLVLLVLFAALVVALDTFPPVVWDEGWTATVARNWVERGFYGMYLNGEPAAAGQTAAFPSVLSIAAAFQFFGIGFWQGRFVSVMYMMGAFSSLYALAKCLYGRRVALVALVALVPFGSMVHMNALYIGRNILAEPPMLFFVLMGFLLFWSAVTSKTLLRAVFALLGATLAWSLTLVSKAQPLPFWCVALAAGLVFCVAEKGWREAGLTFVAFMASLALMRGWYIGLDFFLNGHTLVSTPTPGMLALTAFVLTPEVRLNAVATFLVVGLLLLFGLVYATQRWVRSKSQTKFSLQLVRLMVLSFVWSWTLWFLFLSIDWERYLFPASFVGSIVVGLGLYHFVFGFFRRAGGAGTGRTASRFGMVALMSCVCFVYFFFTVWQIVPQIQPTSFARETTNWLNAHVPATALVETYESEIMFGLKARVHYPPDVVNVEMNRKREIDPTLVLSYDPRTVNADYVVVGYVGHRFHLYDDMLKERRYMLVTNVGPYAIYRNSINADSN